MSTAIQPVAGSTRFAPMKGWFRRMSGNGGISAREAQLRYLSQSVKLEEAINPRLIRMTVLLVSSAVAIFLGWAAVTNINEVARAPGEVVPVGYERVVQHLEGGIVDAIYVKEGEYVEKGKPLVKLQAVGLPEDMAVVQEKIRSLESEAERYKAFLNGRTPDFSRLGQKSDPRVAQQLQIFQEMVKAREEQQRILKDQIEQKRIGLGIIAANRESAEASLSFNKDLLRRRKLLFDKGLIAFTQVGTVENEVNKFKASLAGLAEEKARADREIAEYEKRLLALSSSQREEIYNQLHRIESETKQNEEVLHKLERREERLLVRSPVNGVVKGINVNTIGAVVQSGQNLVSLVPTDEPLIVRTRISPRDVGHLAVGQRVQIKVSSYDFSRYGWLSGKLEFISANTFTDNGGDRYYRARIKLDQRYVGPNPDKNPILPGMTVMSEIITGEKTILAYLLKPVQLGLSTAFTER